VTRVVLPDDDPPPLTTRGARSLLAMCIDVAREELGPDWRSKLLEDDEESGPVTATS